MNHQHSDTFVYNFMPHGHCYLWDPNLLKLQVISNLIIAIAYFLIPLALIYFIKRRKDMVFKLVFVLFGVFIISCGVTHIMDIVVIWKPYYWLDSMLRVFTAVASLATAIALIPLIPKAISLPSPTQLKNEIKEKQEAQERLNVAHKELKLINEELEKRVSERTKELSLANEQLKEEIIEREKAQKKLIRANEELKQFAYIASHDLQEPLRMISNFSSLLQKKYEDKLDEEAKEYIQYSVDGAKRMSSLIHELLSYSNLSTERTFKKTDLNEILKNAVFNLSLQIKENNVEIVQDKLPSLPVEPVQILQLFQNLISNSIKYKSTKIRISSQKSDDYWIFSVHDNGIGIKEEYFERIFVIFQRLHRRDEFPGTGMGLSICKKIIEYHGGKIWLESEPGKGASFFFTLPGEQDSLN